MWIDEDSFYAYGTVALVDETESASKKMLRSYGIQLGREVVYLV